MQTVAKMLWMKSPAEAKAYVESIKNSDVNMDVSSSNSRDSWEISATTLKFTNQKGDKSIPAYETIDHVIGYATEIERIV